MKFNANLYLFKVLDLRMVLTPFFCEIVEYRKYGQLISCYRMVYVFGIRVYCSNISQ